MTKTQAMYTLQAINDLSDILTEQLEEVWEKTALWNTINDARSHVIMAKAIMAEVYNRLLLERD